MSSIVGNHHGNSPVSKGTIYLFCGKMASGKSTLARQIAEQKSVVLISEDALLATLYPGQIIDVASYVHYSGKVKSAIKSILIDLLANGTSVVLDFAANTVNQRKWLKDVAVQADASHELHYLDISDESCKAQLRERSLAEPERQATDTIEMFDAMSAWFEPPCSEEGFAITRHERF